MTWSLIQHNRRWFLTACGYWLGGTFKAGARCGGVLGAACGARCFGPNVVDLLVPVL